MKNNALKTGLSAISTDFKSIKSTPRETLNFSPKAINTMMTEQIVMPPARVWDRIEKILDDQDNRRNNADALISSSFAKFDNHANRTNLYIAAVAAAGVVAGILWKVS